MKDPITFLVVTGITLIILSPLMAMGFNKTKGRER